jgi:spoIIIJ-associated protein
MSIMADSEQKLSGGQEFSGRSVDEAIAEGLAKLGLRNEQVEIEVLNRGSRGIFGLGSEPARVRITQRTATTPATTPAQAPKQTPPTPPTQSAPSSAETSTPTQIPAPTEAQTSQAPSLPQTSMPPSPPVAEAPREAARPRLSNLMDDEQEDYDGREGDESGQAISEEELTDMAVELLGELVKTMGFEASVNATWHEADDNGERYLLLDIHGHDVSPLIGRRGETLASIQYLVRLMINQRIKRWKNVVVDVEQYKERRVNQLTQLAKRMAEQVTQSGRAVSLEPMPANERRIVHLALRDHESVYTQSSGEGERRKVHIVSRS